MPPVLLLQDPPQLFLIISNNCRSSVLVINCCILSPFHEIKQLKAAKTENDFPTYKSWVPLLFHFLRVFLCKIQFQLLSNTEAKGMYVFLNYCMHAIFFILFFMCWVSTLQLPKAFGMLSPREICTKCAQNVD